MINIGECVSTIYKMLIIMITILGLAVRNEPRAITDSYCVHPGEQIVYECTAVGGSFMLWDASFL